MSIRKATQSEAKVAIVRSDKRASSISYKGPAVRAAADGSVLRFAPFEVPLPSADNAREALRTYRGANALLRNCLWPAPYDNTTHIISLGDARDLGGG